MSYTVATLSSVGNSNPITMNWAGGSPFSALATLTSTTMTTDFTVQYTMDDLLLSSAPVWFGLSSAVTTFGYSTLAATHFTSAIADTGVFFGFQFPVAALRLSSTAISSSSLKLKVIQGESW